MNRRARTVVGVAPGFGLDAVGMGREAARGNLERLGTVVGYVDLTAHEVEGEERRHGMAPGTLVFTFEADVAPKVAS